MSGQCHLEFGALLCGTGDIWTSSPSDSSIPLTLGVVWEVSYGSVHSLWAQSLCMGVCLCVAGSLSSHRGAQLSQCSESGQCLKLCCPCGPFPVPELLQVPDPCTEPVLPPGEPQSFSWCLFSGELALELLCRCALLGSRGSLSKAVDLLV